MRLSVDFSNTYSAPTEKQIRLADMMAGALGIEFPTCSSDFTFDAYSSFIETHLATFKRYCWECRCANDCREDVDWWEVTMDVW